MHAAQAQHATGRQDHQLFQVFKKTGMQSLGELPSPLNVSRLRNLETWANQKTTNLTGDVAASCPSLGLVREQCGMCLCISFWPVCGGLMAHKKHLASGRRHRLGGFKQTCHPVQEGADPRWGRWLHPGWSSLDAPCMERVGARGSALSSSRNKLEWKHRPDSTGDPRSCPQP